MIQLSQGKESQLILQTTDIMKRLTAQNNILKQACEIVIKELVKSKVYTTEMKDQLRTFCFTNDADEDILPPDVIEEKEDEVKDEWDISNVM